MSKSSSAIAEKKEAVSEMYVGSMERRGGGMWLVFCVKRRCIQSKYRRFCLLPFRTKSSVNATYMGSLLITANASEQREIRNRKIKKNQEEREDKKKKEKKKIQKSNRYVHSKLLMTRRFLWGTRLTWVSFVRLRLIDWTNAFLPSRIEDLFLSFPFNSSFFFFSRRRWSSMLAILC